MDRRFVSVNDDFASQFQELYGVAYRAAYALLGARAEAEDCAQEALARALAHWARVHKYAAPWVARVSINLALDDVRHQRRADRARPVQYPESSGFDIADRRRDLAVALAALPRRQKEAIVLRYLVDLPESEAANAMGCTIGTIKSTASRGLDRLRAELGPRWAWDE